MCLSYYRNPLKSLTLNLVYLSNNSKLESIYAYCRLLEKRWLYRRLYWSQLTGPLSYYIWEILGWIKECGCKWCARSLIYLEKPLKTFIEVEMMRQAQDLSSQRYLNLMTVSTFLSSVTASTLQITADDSESVLSIIVNTMWFTSLVFSTASAVYSLLIMTWRQSPV